MQAELAARLFLCKVGEYDDNCFLGVDQGYSCNSLFNRCIRQQEINTLKECWFS
jgi:hypothetical protein